MGEISKQNLLYIIHKSIAMKYLTVLKEKKLKTSTFNLCNKEGGI